jgi:N2,N2-dimethylguanosine tRNA methyltransferase
MKALSCAISLTVLLLLLLLDDGAGLRAVRYLKEIEGIRSITLNDCLPEATLAAQVIFSLHSSS